MANKLVCKLLHDKICKTSFFLFSTENIISYSHHFMFFILNITLNICICYTTV